MTAADCISLTSPAPPQPEIDVYTLENVSLEEWQRKIVNVLLYELINGLISDAGRNYLLQLQKEIHDEQRAEWLAHDYQFDDYGID